MIVSGGQLRRLVLERPDGRRRSDRSDVSAERNAFCILASAGWNARDSDAIVVGHNLWSSDLLRLIVTLIGWLTLIRSIILLFLSPEAIGRLMKAVRYEQNYYLFTAIPLVIGLYLTVAGLGSG
jgi:hypothetical protein